MKPLELTLALAEREVPSSASLRVKATLSNASASPREVPESDPMTPWPLEYVLAPLEPAGRTYRLSREEYRARRAGPDVLPPSAPSYRVLGPGESISSDDDLAEFAIDPIAPGRYRLSAQIKVGSEAVESAPHEVVVTAMRVAAAAESMDAAVDALGTVVEHEAEGGRRLLYQRESPGPEPGVGLLRRRAESGRGAADLAVATATGAVEGRWFAWMERTSLHGARGWDDAVMDSPAAVGVDVGSPRFVGGCQFPDQSAVFLVVGSREGRACVQDVRFAGGAAATKGAPLPIGDAPPLAILARPASADALQLAWAERTADGCRVLVRPFRLVPPQDQGAPTVLASFRRPLAAMCLTPSAEATSVEVLLAPAADRMLTSVTVDLVSGGTAGRDVTFEAPPSPVDAWDVAPARGGGAVVLARTASGLLWARTGGRPPTWAAVPGAPPQAALPHLLAHRGRVWAAWAEPGPGLRYSLLVE